MRSPPSIYLRPSVITDLVITGCVSHFDYRYGTGTVRWRAEGAALGSQSELSPELMSPPRKRRRRRRSWLAKRADTSYHKIYGYRYRYTGTLLRLYIPVFGIPMTADPFFFHFLITPAGPQTKFRLFLFLCPCPPQLWGAGGGEVDGWAGAARGCGPTPEPFHTTKLCTTGMLFTPKAFQGSEKSTVDFILLTEYTNTE